MPPSTACPQTSCEEATVGRRRRRNSWGLGLSRLRTSAQKALGLASLADWQTDRLAFTLPAAPGSARLRLRSRLWRAVSRCQACAVNGHKTSTRQRTWLGDGSPKIEAQAALCTASAQCQKSRQNTDRISARNGLAHRRGLGGRGVRVAELHHVLVVGQHLRSKAGAAQKCPCPRPGFLLAGCAQCRRGWTFLVGTARGVSQANHEASPELVGQSVVRASSEGAG